MTLGDILSKPPMDEYKQVQGFLLNKKGKIGQQEKLSSCNIALNYYCNNCDDTRTFCAIGNISCIFESKNLISIDCILSCNCGSTVRVWFLVESKNDITQLSPEIRIIKKTEKFSEGVSLIDNGYGDFTEALEKAKRAAREGFGAGSVVYLRTVFESIIKQIGNAEGIKDTFTDKKGKEQHKSTERYLKEVDEKRHIIPTEFSSDGYKLFRELSGVVHGNYSEEEALLKFDAFYRLVTGVLDSIKNSRELMDAIGRLGWNVGGEAVEQA
ncbi:MAG: hypothetical protein RR313_08930 [Anaerovoracaceae bacterium]